MSWPVRQEASQLDWVRSVIGLIAKKDAITDCRHGKTHGKMVHHWCELVCGTGHTCTSQHSLSGFVQQAPSELGQSPKASSHRHVQWAGGTVLLPTDHVSWWLQALPLGHSAKFLILAFLANFHENESPISQLQFWQSLNHLRALNGNLNYHQFLNCNFGDHWEITALSRALSIIAVFSSNASILKQCEPAL